MIFLLDKRELPLNEEKNDSKIGRAILSHCLEKQFGIKEFSICFGENGKPYLKDNPVYFNISHSGNYVVCAFSENEIGCDVEKEAEYKERIAKRFFTEKEAETLKNAENKNEIFTLLWTLKESVLKKDGDGISGGLDTYDFSKNLNGESFSKYGCYFSVFKLDGAFLTVCSDKKVEKIKVTAEEILWYINNQK